jgi:hypothetical protein
MRYFLDAEFNGFGGQLVSIALAPENAAANPFYEALDAGSPSPGRSRMLCLCCEPRQSHAL